MYARVTHSKGDPAKADEGIRFIREKAVANVKTQPGFKHGYWLVDRKSGAGIAITLWESEQAMKATDASAKQLVDHVPSGIQVTGVERYEVVAEA